MCKHLIFLRSDFESGKPCIVVGEDIDLLVLLIALSPENSKILFMKPGRGKVPTKIFSSQSLDHKPIIKKNILVVHAFSGCDCTSAVYGKGKISFCTLLEKRPDLAVAAEIFKSRNSTQNSIGEAGVKFFLGLYSAPKSVSSLNEYRFTTFRKNVITAKKKQLFSLPPTDDAAKLHSYRVFHQIQLWQGYELPPENWGWRIHPNVAPIYSTIGPAPQKVLQSIFCRCTKGCSNACGCRRTGLRCTSTCLNCLGTSCTNGPAFDMEDAYEDENIDDPLSGLEDIDELMDDWCDDEPPSEADVTNQIADPQPSTSKGLGSKRRRLF